MGRKAAGREVNCITRFETVYKPGTLQAISYANGEVLGSTKLETSGKPVELHIEIEHGTAELVYVNITLCDEQGRVVMNQDTTLRLQVFGSELLGFGCANPRFTHRFNENCTETFLGKAQAILRRNREVIHVSVEADNGLEGNLEI